MTKISNFYLVSVAEWTGFLSWFVGNSEDRFSPDEACVMPGVFKEAPAYPDLQACILHKWRKMFNALFG